MYRAVRVAILVLCWCGFTQAVMGAETGLLTRKSDIQEQPSMKSSSIGEVPAGTPVSVLQRQGVWFEVAVKGSSMKGWVRFSRVKMTAHKADKATTSAAGGSTNALANLARSATGVFAYGGRNSQPDGVSTIGIRGLQAQDLANAAPNPAARREMESHRATQQQADLYAKVASLRPQQVAYLEDSAEGGLSLGGFSLSLPTSSGTSNAISGTKE